MSAKCLAHRQVRQPGDHQEYLKEAWHDLFAAFGLVQMDFVFPANILQDL